LIWIKAARAVIGAGLALHSAGRGITDMSATHPSEVFSTSRKEFLAGHEQLKPFLLAVAMFVVVAAVALAFTGLPQ
jgi:hypothetical protein